MSVLSCGCALCLLAWNSAPSEFIALRDIPKPLSRRPVWFYVKMSLAMPLVPATSSGPTLTNTRG